MSDDDEYEPRFLYFILYAHYQSHIDDIRQKFRSMTHGKRVRYKSVVVPMPRTEISKPPSELYHQEERNIHRHLARHPEEWVLFYFHGRVALYYRTEIADGFGYVNKLEDYPIPPEKLKMQPTTYPPVKPNK